MTWNVEIKEWHAIANWTWKAGDDVCSICRMPFDGCPPDCKVGAYGNQGRVGPSWAHRDCSDRDTINNAQRGCCQQLLDFQVQV